MHPIIRLRIRFHQKWPRCFYAVWYFLMEGSILVSVLLFLMAMPGNTLFMVERMVDGFEVGEGMALGIHMATVGLLFVMPIVGSLLFACTLTSVYRRGRALHEGN